MGLPCSHDISNILTYTPQGAIERRDIHPYWHFTKPAAQRPAEFTATDEPGDDDAPNDNSNDDELLNITEPVVHRGKGSPK